MLTKNSIAYDLVSREQPYAQARQLLEAWGSWLSSLYPWQWFVTLTFRDPPVEKQALGWTRPGWSYAKKGYNQLIGRLQPALGDLVWFRAFELQKWRGAPHIHALIGGLDNEKYAEVASWWWQRYGFSRFLEYDSQLGAAFYLCKYVTKELGDIEFSPGLTKSNACAKVVK